jgi:hypothetical protein
MVDEKPLRGDEDEYRTEQATPDVAPSGDPLQPESPAASSQPWLIVGVVLLAVFVVVLIVAVLVPALR